MKKSKILGTGSYHPKKILSNEDLEKIVDTSDEWIIERTGMKERRIADLENGEHTSDLGLKASQKAIEMSGLDANDIDCIIFATSTPDYIMPNTSCILQEKLNITNNCAAFDIVEACSGFVYAMTMADSFIRTGVFKNVLLVGADVLSHKLNYEDRNSCILFGDGAGAVIVSESNDDSEILTHTLKADASAKEFIAVWGGGCVKPVTQEVIDNKEDKISLSGKETFKLAVKTLAANSHKVLEDAKVSPSDVNWLVPHQANLRIIEATAKRMDFPMEKVIVNIDRFANTSAATIPTAFDEAVRDGRIKRGDIVLFTAFGAGVTSGANLLKF